MTHYGIVEWVDFARGLTTGADRVLMRRHLDEGCLECGRIVAFCDRLALLCRVMAGVQAPDAAVLRARAIFPIRRPERHRRAIRIPVELIYDSFLAPAPAGLRASWQVGWQALYRAGDCSVDLRIEPDLRSTRMALIGQIRIISGRKPGCPTSPFASDRGRTLLPKRSVTVSASFRWNRTAIPVAAFDLCRWRSEVHPASAQEIGFRRGRRSVGPADHQCSEKAEKCRAA